MQAYRDFGTGDLKKFPGSLLDADFGTHFPGSASVSTTYNSAKVGAPGGSKARIEAIRGMLFTIIRTRLGPPLVPRFVAALSAAEANAAKAEPRGCSEGRRGRRRKRAGCQGID
jgi:hypothetical protein